jgi:hypothetical protein
MLPPSAIIQKGGFSMTEHEKYQEHIRHTHDAFCKGAFGKSRACRSPVRTITDGTGNHFLVLLPTIDA